MVQKNVFVILERWGDDLAITTYSSKRKAQAKFDDIAKRLKQGAQTKKKYLRMQNTIIYKLSK